MGWLIIDPATTSTLLPSGGAKPISIKTFICTSSLLSYCGIFSGQSIFCSVLSLQVAGNQPGLLRLSWLFYSPPPATTTFVPRGSNLPYSDIPPHLHPGLYSPGYVTYTPSPAKPPVCSWPQPISPMDHTPPAYYTGFSENPYPTPQQFPEYYQPAF